jgi:L-galactose dehydrogenase/L-glyceraldehyde 3-phosphate reductase
LEYRKFGRTGLEVSNLIFGAGNVGGILIGKDDDTKRAAIRTALDGGINWIDTASRYGDGVSEKSLGWLLAEIDDTPFVSTKFNLDTDRLDDIAGQIEESLRGSLERLGRDSVDLLQLHNRIGPGVQGRMIGVDHILGTGGVADALDRLRDKGLFRFMGITALGDTACCRQVIESGRFDSAQVYYNLLNPSAGRPVPATWVAQNFDRLIDVCHDNGVAVIVIRPFAAGVIATDQRTGRESVLTTGTDLASEERQARAVFDILGSEHGTRAQTALRFVLANPKVSCIDVGIGELSHVGEALGAVDLGPLPEDALARLDALYASNFGEA